MCRRREANAGKEEEGIRTMGGRGSGGPGKISMEDGSLPRQLTAASTVWDSGLHDQTHEAPETIIVSPSAHGCFIPGSPGSNASSSVAALIRPDCARLPSN